MRKVLMTAVVAAALSPALAYSDAPADGSFIAVDFDWLANGGTGNELTIAPGQTVSFAYPVGNNLHNVVFEGKQPSACTGVQPDDPGPGWEGSCRFDDAGTFGFVCGVHDGMTGRVIVRAAPAPTPTPTSTATRTPTPTPTPTGDPTGGSNPTTTTAPSPGATNAPVQTKLKLTLARTQRSMRVRGAVEVEQAGARLTVTARTNRRVGRFVRRSTGPGTAVFSVGLDAKARRVLRAKHRLTVTVRVALTPRGGKPLTRRAKTTLTGG
jgi:plastocyanin